MDTLVSDVVTLRAGKVQGNNRWGVVVVSLGAGGSTILASLGTLAVTALVPASDG